MSQTDKETIEYKIIISIPQTVFQKNYDSVQTPMTFLKSIALEKSVFYEIVTDAILKLEIRIFDGTREEMAEVKAKLETALQRMGYNPTCVSVSEEKADDFTKAEAAWEDLGKEEPAIGDFPDTEKEAAVGTEPEPEEPDEPEDTMEPEPEGFSEPEPDPKKESTALSEINGLIGANSLKRFAKQMADSAHLFRKYYMTKCVKQRILLFMVEEGNGFSHYLELLSRHMEEIGLVECPAGRIYANEVPSQPLNSDFLSVLGTLSVSSSYLGIDLAPMLDKVGTREFHDFLRGIEVSSKPPCIAFRIPCMDELSKKKIVDQLQVHFMVECIDIPIISMEQCVEFATRYSKEMGYVFAGDALPLLEQCIYQEKADQRFYGFKTVMKVVEEMIYQKNLADSTNTNGEDSGFLILPEDVKRVLKNYETEENAESLEDLIGIESIKERLDEIVAQIMLSKKMGRENSSSLHMRFVGNPGTGKTTVARLLGRMLKEKGVLSKGQFFEYKGRDFVGRYIGETTPKTASICRDAYGSILFIDEAYTLYKGSDNERDYGPEALAELMTHMENHREDFLVIMAGYTDEMEKLMTGNIGLESRMPYEIYFPNYSKEQLYEIFLSMAGKDYKCSEGLKKVAKEYFESIPQEILDQKEFANARFVRNLFERTVAKAALRIQMEPQQEELTVVELKECDFAKAMNDREFQKMQEKQKPTIGFC